MLFRFSSAGDPCPLRNISYDSKGQSGQRKCVSWLCLVRLNYVLLTQQTPSRSFKEILDEYLSSYKNRTNHIMYLHEYRVTNERSTRHRKTHPQLVKEQNELREPNVHTLTF